VRVCEGVCEGVSVFWGEQLWCAMCVFVCMVCHRTMSIDRCVCVRVCLCDGERVRACV
jgi:hypothetical protein